MALKNKIIEKTTEFKSIRLFKSQEKINATFLKKMLISARNNLQNNVDAVNEMNVFPVPDADTGANMLATMNGGIEQIKKIPISSGCSVILNFFSKGALLGARGNSGVILSQFFNGLKNGANNLNEISLENWSQMLSSAKESAYKAVLKPVEGTILTVIRESYEKIENQKFSSTLDLFEKYVENAKASLKKTPEILEVLKQARVVDAGGFGLVFILEGMLSVLKGTEIKIVNNQPKNYAKTKFGYLPSEKQNFEFGFCTEVIIRKKDENITENEIHNEVTKFFEEQNNDSNILIVEEDVIKIHTHAQKPGNLLNFVEKFGTIEKIKIENMSVQAEKHLYIDKEKKQAPLKRSLRTSLAIVVVSNAKGFNEKFKELGVDYILDGGQSMNPSVNDFLKAYEILDAKTVYVFANNSNIFLTALQSQKEEKLSSVVIVETKSLHQGYAALFAFNRELSSHENLKEIKNRLKKIKTGSLAKSIKNVTLNKVKIKEDDYIVSLNEKIIHSEKDLFHASKYLIAKAHFKKAELITLFLGKNFNNSITDLLTDYIKNTLKTEYEVIHGDQEIYDLMVVVE